MRRCILVVCEVLPFLGEHKKVLVPPRTSSNKFLVCRELLWGTYSSSRKDYLCHSPPLCCADVRGRFAHSGCPHSPVVFLTTLINKAMGPTGLVRAFPPCCGGAATVSVSSECLISSVALCSSSGSDKPLLAAATRWFPLILVCSDRTYLLLFILFNLSGLTVPEHCCCFPPNSHPFIFLWSTI